MKKCSRVKNPCKICLESVTDKTGLQCKGACKKWIHFTCLNYTPGKIQDIKAGFIIVTCPCPNCDNQGNAKETISYPPPTCGKQGCPANAAKPKCDVKDCPKNNKTTAAAPIPANHIAETCPSQEPKAKATKGDPTSNIPPCCVPPEKTSPCGVCEKSSNSQQNTSESESDTTCTGPCKQGDQSDTSVSNKSSKTKQKDSKTKKKDSKTKQKDSKTKQKDSKTKQKDSKTKQKDSKTKQKDSKTKQKDSKTKQKDSKTKQKDQKPKSPKGTKSPDDAQRPKCCEPSQSPEGTQSPKSKKSPKRTKSPKSSTKSKKSADKLPKSHSCSFMSVNEGEPGANERCCATEDKKGDAKENHTPPRCRQKKTSHSDSKLSAFKDTELMGTIAELCSAVGNLSDQLKDLMCKMIKNADKK